MISHVNPDDCDDLAVKYRNQADLKELDINEANFTNMNATVELIDYKFSSKTDSESSDLLHNLCNLGDICCPEDRS